MCVLPSTMPLTVPPPLPLTTMPPCRQTSMESCISAADSASSDEMSELVQNFYNTFHDRVHTQSAYFGAYNKLHVGYHAYRDHTRL